MLSRKRTHLSMKEELERRGKSLGERTAMLTRGQGEEHAKAEGTKVTKTTARNSRSNGTQCMAMPSREEFKRQIEIQRVEITLKMSICLNGMQQTR
jgi:hypothetical protein